MSNLVGSQVGYNTHESRLQALTHATQQVSPLLVGLKEGIRIIPPHTDASLLPDTQISANHHIEALHRYWQDHYPEAGKAYWQTRTWTMLIWQPITVALVATYYRSEVPSIRSMMQGFHEDTGLVAQFNFAETNWRAGDQHQRQTIAAEELIVLLDQLRSGLNAVCHTSLAMTDKLLADTLSEMLLRGLQSLVNRNQLPKIQLHSTFARELTHWKQALDLPLSRFGRLNVSSEGEFFIQRRACCMHYRRRDGSYCQGCPQKK